MRLGPPRAYSADCIAGPHQQSRRGYLGLLYRLADLGKCNRRDRTGRRIELLGQPQAFRLAVVRGSARYHTGK